MATKTKQTKTKAATKKPTLSRKPKTPAEVNQENVKEFAFAFPTRKGMKALAKAEKKALSTEAVIVPVLNEELPVVGISPTPEQVLKRNFGFIVGDRVHLGDAHEFDWIIICVDFVRPPEVSDCIRVTVQKDVTVHDDGEVLTCLVSGHELVAITKPEIEKKVVESSAEQMLKKDYNLAVGDRVKDPDDKAVGTVKGAFFVNSTDGVRTLKVSVLFSEHVGLEILNPKSLTKYEERKIEKVAFRDIVIFGAFSVKGRTFVKVGNSTAIAAFVRGSESEPFAMLATPNTKLLKSAKRSFKQSDKVLPYAG